MSFKRCPGSMSFTQPKIELVRCSNCGDDAEVWSDEADGKCAKCGHTVCRTTSQSCIDWCKYAKECLGDEEHKRYQDMKTRLRKETLLRAGEAYLADENQKGQARARVTQAEQLLRHATAADPNVVIAAAALLGVRRVSQETDSAALAAEILHQLGYPEGFIREVCGIVRSVQEPVVDPSINGRLVLDADRLVRGTVVAEPVS